MISCFSRARGVGLVLVGAVGLARAEPTTVNQIPIDLPRYEVLAERELPPPEQWFYARIEGFEVLSNSSEDATKQLLKEFQHFAFALDQVWPGMRANNAVPAALIICGRKEKFEEFLPDNLRQTERATTTFHRRDREQAAIVLDDQTKILNLVTVEDTSAAPTPVAATPASEAGEETDGTSATPGFAVDSYQQLRREFLRYLLAGMEAPPPPWFAEGVSQLFMSMRITETEIAVGRVENPNLAAERGGTRAGATPADDRDFNAALARRALLPMAEMFAVTADSETAQNPLNNAWAKQCYAFVHWGLYGDLGRHQKEFLTFVRRLSREPLSEAVFKECFKQSYEEMLFSLRTHIENTRSKVAGVRAAKGEKLPLPPAPVVREATEAEVGRLKGDTLRLAGHPVEARTVLVTSYRRGEREPNLLAALGLAELEVGDVVRARKFLEAAATGKANRPRAYVELARLRLVEGLAKPEGHDGKLSATQLGRVLEPLYATRGQMPPLAEAYGLMVAAWRASGSAPTADHLAVIEEGVRQFPREGELVYGAAELRAKSGFLAEAHGLVRLGLRVTSDASMRVRLEQLQRSLPPAPPVAAAPAAK